MKKSPCVPGELEEAILNIAGQFAQRAHINVYSEELQLKIHVTAQFRQAVMWEVSDYFYSIEQLESMMQNHFRSRPGVLNKSNLLFVWNSATGRLQKRIVPEVDVTSQGLSAGVGHQ